MPVFDPSRYSEVPTRELLDAAAFGFIGVDQRLVKALLERGPKAATEVAEFAKEPTEEHRIDVSQLVVDLLRHWQAPGALDVYMDVIRQNPDEVGDELIQALLPFKEQAIEPLLVLYEELGEEQGSDTAFALAGLQLRDPRILGLLLERLEYDTADGAFLLGLYGDIAAKPALEKMLTEIEADDLELRREIQYALEQLGREMSAYEPSNVDVFREYPKTDIPALDLMTEEERVEMLASPDADTRSAAAQTFFNHELSATAQRELLRLAENDPDAAVRGRAWAGLADVTADEKTGAAMRDKMVAILNDTSREVEERGGAAVGLYGVADQDAPAKAIEALLNEGGPNQKVTKAKALEAMWRSLWKPFAKHFSAPLGDPDPAIVRQALRGAGYFQLTREIEKIASYFHRDEPFDDLREDALFAYALAMPGETTRGRVRGMLRKIDELAHLTSDEEEVVKFALDERLRLAGQRPVFEEESGEEEEEAPAPTPEPAAMKAGRNDPCPCGSGKKFKKCHGQ